MPLKLASAPKLIATKAHINVVSEAATIVPAESPGTEEEEEFLAPPKKKQRLESNSLVVTTENSDSEPAPPNPDTSFVPVYSTPRDGSFCLYAMALPFLQAALVDPKTNKKDYQALYLKIRYCQERGSRTAKCYISFPPSKSTCGYGRFVSVADGLTDPISEKEYDIGISSLSYKEYLSIPSDNLKGVNEVLGDSASRGAVTGATLLTYSHCGIASARGLFHFATTPIWEGMRDQKIYEGYMSFNVKYSGLYSGKGHGSGSSVNLSFWAIRSQNNQCMDAGNTKYLAYSGPQAALDYDEDSPGYDDMMDSIYGSYGSDSEADYLRCDHE